MARLLYGLGGLFALLSTSGTAAAATGEVQAAANLIVTLIGIALLLWIVGNLLTYYRYDSGGPKGGPLQKP